MKESTNVAAKTSAALTLSHLREKTLSMNTSPLILIYTVIIMFCVWLVMPLNAEERYRDNGDGTITDHQTNLTIIKNTNCFGKKGWQAARSVVQALADGSCGLTDGSVAGDWQLPNKESLPYLLEWSESGLFSGMQAHFYWSNKVHTKANATSRLWIWVLYLGNGYIGKDDAVNGNYVWPVRDKP